MQRSKKYESLLYGRLCASAYCVQKKDLVSAAEVMASAFSDDPAIRYLLGGEHMGMEDWRYFHCVLSAVYGKCIMLSTDESLNNLLILFPPHLKAVPAFRFLFCGGIRLRRFFGSTLFFRSLRYERNCQAIKSRFLSSQTWYCMCFVVSPQMQGQNFGSRLIRPVLDVLDSESIPLYLETHTETNISIFIHLGFSKVDTSHIPGTNIKQYAMLRKQ